jgi:hypothetical protein
MSFRRGAAAVLLVVSGPIVFRAWSQNVFTADPSPVSAATGRDDARAIGMGRVRQGLTRGFNAMLNNPAHLALPRTVVDVLNVQASLPIQTFDALAFLRDNSGNIKSGTFLKQIRDGVTLYQDPGATPDDQARAVALVNEGLSFVRGFRENVLGPDSDPHVQALSLFPAVQAQVGTFGAALFGTVQSGFQSFPTETFNYIASLQLPPDLNTLTPDQLLQLGAIVLPLFDGNGNLTFREAVPTTFAVAYLDVVGAAGWGHRITPEIAVGGLLKVVNRRFTAKTIDSDNYDRIISEARHDFSQSTTGVTLDLGALYIFPETGTTLALSLQNIIPITTVRSQADLSLVVYDDGGNPVPVRVLLPFELRSPFLMNIGAAHPLYPWWDVGFDWVDIAAQDEGYEDYLQRFRLGTEVRLEAVPGSLGVAFRGGLSDSRLTYGVGLNLFNIVSLDGAHAYDPAIADYAYVVQARFGW